MSSSFNESKQNIQQIIELCLKAKKWFIEIDEFDQKERLLLNYGHTFGHALESALDFSLSHGVAVGIGMMVAVEFSRRQLMLADEGLSRVEKLERYTMGLLAGVEGLESVLRRIDLDSLVDCFGNDKKHLPDRYRMIVPGANGSLVLHEMERGEKSLQVIKDAFGNTIEKFVGGIF